jgi:large subunit ribosomal protein L21
MYAVIQTGGKQYRVAEKDTVTVEKLEAKPGSEISLDQVLLVADGDKLTFGKPLVKGAKVTAKVVEQDRGHRIRVFRFKKRKGYRKTIGHRQYVTRLLITKISL